MSAIEELTRRGLSFHLKGERLIVTPKEKLDEPASALIRMYREGIMVALRNRHSLLAEEPTLSAVLAEARRVFGDDVEMVPMRQRRRDAAPSTQWTAPRPTVRCGECLHFHADTIGDGTGIGDCLINGEGTGRFSPALWPLATRWCKDFRNSASRTGTAVGGV